MVRLAFFIIVAIIGGVIFIFKWLAGDLTGSEKLKGTTFQDETKKVMDTTAKGISWMEQQWEQSKKEASDGKTGRFVAYNDGAVMDRQTNLMWAATDNGSGINWVDAERYCKNYRAGGYIDWRLPTQDELSGLYLYNGRENTITSFINLTNDWFWASDTLGDTAAGFSFRNGLFWNDKSYTLNRALPVRSVQKVIAK
jgi:hypothetical protein